MSRIRVVRAIVIVGAAILLLFVHATPITYWCVNHIEQDQHDPFSDVENFICKTWWRP